MGKYRYISMADRRKIAEWYLNGDRPCDMAERLGIHVSTIYNELRRGQTDELDKNQRPAYNPELAQRTVQANLRQRGRKAESAKREGCA